MSVVERMVSPDLSLFQRFLLGLEPQKPSGELFWLQKMAFSPLCLCAEDVAYRSGVGLLLAVRGTALGLPGPFVAAAAV